MKWIPGLMIFFTLAARAEPAADQDRLVDANTAFAFDLMGRVMQAQPGANVFISPFSVSSVLQMVENGAAGATKTEMQQALKTSGLSAASLNAAFRGLNQQFTARKDVTLNLANGLWFQAGFHLKPAFADDNRKFFQAELSGVDFGDPQSARTINDWADQQTRGKIKEVVQFPFDPLTRLILANAIYFKGKWDTPFKKSATRPHPFHLANGESKRTPMMAQDGDFAYQENPDFQAVKLPYAGGLQMELYLPGTNSTPKMFLAGTAGSQKWRDNIQAGFRRREGSVTLPKFKIEYEIRLNEPLEALGMTSAFDRNADFSGIANEPLFISAVKQKSFVDVNEEGTEAAAVTSVTMEALSIRMPPPDRFTMVLDRPFFFVISDVSTGSILFMGVVNDPAGD
jgi:serine protease inhibitor